MNRKNKIVSPMMPEKASIFIIDDDRELIEILTEYLSSEGFDIAVALDGREAIERLPGSNFDLVILDVMLPSMNGFDILRHLRQSHSMPVIMLSARGEEIDRIVGLELGADDYMPKPFNPRELVARIRAVLRRAGPGPDGIEPTLILGSLQLDPETFDVISSGKHLRLTGAEFRLLKLLMHAPGQIQSRESLSLRVLGRPLRPYDRSIDTHVSNLRRKLNCGEAGTPEIRNLRGAGYVIAPNHGEAS